VSQGHYLNLVLDAHLPYVRSPGEDESMQESWLFLAAAECYLPLLETLDRLDRDGVAGSLTICASTALLEMLSDPQLNARFDEYLRRRIQLCHSEIRRFTDPDCAAAKLAQWWLVRAEAKLDFFHRLPDQSIAAAIATHCVTGRIELIPSVSGGAILPLVADQDFRQLHLSLTAASFEQRFGFSARGIWLPGCAYEPELETLILEEGFRYTFLAPQQDSSTTSPTAVGPEGLMFFTLDRGLHHSLLSAVDAWPDQSPYRDRPTFDPQDLLKTGLCRPHMARFASDPHGSSYQRCSDTRPLVAYDPAAALLRAQDAAEQFVEAAAVTAGVCPGQLSSVAVDAELLGYGWFEGLWFLEHVFRRAEQNNLLLTSPSSFVAHASPVIETNQPGLSSIGYRGYLEGWLNERTLWAVARLERAESNLRLALDRFRESQSARISAILGQATRELILAQSGDWLAMLSEGRNAGFASERFLDHVSTVERLVELAHRRGKGGRGFLGEREAAWPFLEGVTVAGKGIRKEH